MATAEISEYVDLLVKRLDSEPEKATTMLKTLSKKDQDKYLTDVEKAAIHAALRKSVLYKAQTKLMKIVLGEKPKRVKKKQRIYYTTHTGAIKYHY